MPEVQEFLLSLVGSPWLYPVFAFLIALAAAIPPVPSSALIVALGAVNAQSGTPNVAFLLVFGTIGSVMGDHVVYSLGRHVPFERLPILRSTANQHRIATLGQRTADGGLMLAVIARFIPLGRTLIALVCGSRAMPRRTWLGLSLWAGGIWTAYSIAFGWFSARWLPLPMWLSVVIAVAGSLAAGLVISKLVDRFALKLGS